MKRTLAVLMLTFVLLAGGCSSNSPAERRPLPTWRDMYKTKGGWLKPRKSVSEKYGRSFERPGRDRIGSRFKKKDDDGGWFDFLPW